MVMLLEESKRGFDSLQPHVVRFPKFGPVGIGIFLQAGAKPEGKENASEEAGDVSDDFANGEGQFT